MRRFTNEICVLSRPLLFPLEQLRSMTTTIDNMKARQDGLKQISQDLTVEQLKWKHLMAATGSKGAD